MKKQKVLLFGMWHKRPVELDMDLKMYEEGSAELKINGNF